MRILVLTWKDPLAPDAGGAERYLVEVATRWVRAGHEVTIAGPKRGKRASGGGSDNGIRYAGLGSKLTVFHQARRQLRAHGSAFDRVVESVSTRPFAAHRIVGDKAVALYHQTAEEVWRMEFPFPISWLGQHVLEPRWIRGMRPARVVAVSPSTADSLRRYNVATEAIIPPGCVPPQTTVNRLAPSATPHLIWLGRLVRTKRPRDAISAFKRVREVIPGATLDLVGGGYLERAIRREHHQGVTVHGLVDETLKASLLSRADLLLLPGTREGWGIAALEAASYGVPVVAYDIPGLRDVVLHRVTGVVVPASAAELGSAAAKLLEDPQRWTFASRAGQERARQFTWDVTAQHLLRVVARRCGGRDDPITLGARLPNPVSCEPAPVHSIGPLC
jgi:glycosyltransferase involved in cell wall biosynthesis